MLRNHCKQQVLQGLIQLEKHLRDAIYQSFATLGKNYFTGDWETSFSECTHSYKHVYLQHI